MRLNNRGNWSLIGILAAAAIVVILSVVYFGGGDTMTVKEDSELLDQSSEKQTVVGKALDTGKAEDCRQRLHQIRVGVESYKAMSVSEGNPPTLKDIGLGVSSSYFYCPVSGKAYEYDPSNGTVRCPTHPDF